MADIQTLLDDAVEEEITNVKSAPAGSEERSLAIQDLTALHKLRIEEIKAQTEAEEKRERREMDKADHAREEALQARQAKDQVIDRCVRTCVQVGELVLPLVCYGIWFGMGLTFEMDSSITSTMFKNLLNRFRPTK